MPQSRHPTEESVRVSTEAAKRFLCSIHEVARIAEWDLQNEAFREHVQRLWQVKRGTHDVLCVLAELQLLEWIQQFAKHFPFLLFMDDDALLKFLLKSMQQSIQCINDYSTAIGDLWLGGGAIIASPRSIFEVPGVLLEALQEATIGPSMLDLVMDQQQRRYDALFIYLLCHAATNLCRFKSNAASPFSLSEWQLFFQEYVWRYTTFSFSSDMVKSMVAMYWFDNFLMPSNDQLPYDLKLEHIDKLVYAERRDNRLETISEITQLDYYLVVSACVDRLVTIHPNDENAWKMARRWYSAHISASLAYMEQLKENGVAATTEMDPPHVSSHIVYPFLIDLKVSCHFTSPLRWHSAVRLAFDLTELKCLSQDEKTEVWQCLYHEMLWNDYPVLFYNCYAERRPEFRMQTIDFLLAAPRSSLAFHVLFCDMVAFRDDVQGMVTLSKDERSYIHRLVVQMLWRLLFRQYSSLVYIPVEYRKILLAEEMAVDDTTLDRRLRQLIQDALPLPPTWRLETLDDHWQILFEELADLEKSSAATMTQLEGAVVVVAPPVALHNGGPAVDFTETVKDSTEQKPLTDSILKGAEEVVEDVVETENQQDEYGIDDEDADMESIHESETPSFRWNRPDKNVPKEDDNFQEEDDAPQDEGKLEDEADMTMDDESEDSGDEGEGQEEDVQEVYDVDVSSDDSRHHVVDAPQMESGYSHRGAPEDAELLDDESTETETEPSENSSSTSHAPECEQMEYDEDEEEEIDKQEEEEEDDGNDDDDTEHPTSIASSYIGSELTDQIRDGQDPDDDDNEAGYDAEESQDAATEEENEDLFVGERPSTEQTTPAASSFHESNSSGDHVPIVPIATHNEASTLVDKGYEPDSQGQNDVEGVPQPLRIMEAGYDAEDSQGHSEDEEVFDEEDDQPRQFQDHFPSIQNVMPIPPPTNGSPRLLPHVPRHTLSTDDMIADDEAESSEIEGEGGVEPAMTTHSSLEGGSLLMQVAASVQIEHFLTQPATPSQETRPLSQPSYNDDPTESHDRSEAVLDRSLEIIVNVASDTMVETPTEPVADAAIEDNVVKATEVAETANTFTYSESVEYALPEADEESESSDSVRSHPGDEISCPVSVASSPQSSVGMQSAAKSEAAISPSNMMGPTVLMASQEEQKLSPKAQALKETPASSPSSTVKSKSPSVHCEPPVPQLSDAKRNRVPPIRLDATEDPRKVPTRHRSPAIVKKTPPQHQALRLTTPSAAKRPREIPAAVETVQPATRSRLTAKVRSQSPSVSETSRRTTRSQAMETQPMETSVPIKRPPSLTKSPEPLNAVEAPQSATGSQRVTRSRSKMPPEPSTPVETPERVTRSRAIKSNRPDTSTAVQTPEPSALSRATSDRVTRARTKALVKPPVGESPASSTLPPHETRVTRSRAGKPPAIPVDSTKTMQRVTRSKRDT